MLILVDQDNVLADFESAFHAAWQARGHSHPALPPANRRSFYVRDDYPAELRAEVEAIYTAPAFFRDLPPLPGAVEAIAAMLASGLDVRICTSPLNHYRHCVPEKFEWVERHLGADFISRMVVTKDKTIVRGSFLIDDCPEVKGSRPPEWTHLVFDQPYNRHASGVRITWDNWQEVLVAQGDGLRNRGASGTSLW